MFRKSWNIFKSFGHAFYGIYVAFRDERNMRVHGLFTIVAICFIVFLKVTTMEFLILVLDIALVWIAELMNTSIEESFNIHAKDQDVQIKVGKDVAAGAVLVASFNALLAGVVIFIPKLLLLIK